MNLEQLRALARDWLDDDAANVLWSDERLDQYFNEAVREAAVRARLLLDSTTEDVCQIALVVGQAAYELHPSVIFVRRAALALSPATPLERTQYSVLDDNFPNWRTATGAPEYLVPNLNRQSITVVPIPAVVDTLHLTVVRYPTESELLEDEDDEPAIAEQHHEALCHWVCWRALMKRDVEKYSPEEAKTHLAAFESVFGAKPTARQLQSLATEPTTSTQSYWF